MLLSLLLTFAPASPAPTPDPTPVTPVTQPAAAPAAGAEPPVTAEDDDPFVGLPVANKCAAEKKTADEAESAFLEAQRELFDAQCNTAAAAWNQDKDKTFICVDMTDPRSPRSKVIHSDDKRDRKRKLKNRAPRADAPNLFAASRVKVHVWYPKDGHISVDLSGTPSHARAFYIDPKSDLAGKGPGPGGCPYFTPPKIAVYPKEFASRIPEAGKEHVTLTVTYTSGTTVLPYAVDYLVEHEYWGALRTGLAMSFAPWDAEYTLVSADSGNPGKRIALKDGGPPGGIAALELQLGVSFFPGGRVREYSQRPRLGLYAGLGLGSASTKGLGFLSSVGVGPELVIGPRFSIGLIVGLRFTRRLERGHALGDAVESSLDVVPTRFGVTPQFGILLNLTPKIVAFVRKGGA